MLHEYDANKNVQIIHLILGKKFTQNLFVLLFLYENIHLRVPCCWRIRKRSMRYLKINYALVHRRIQNCDREWGYNTIAIRPYVCTDFSRTNVRTFAVTRSSALSHLSFIVYRQTHHSTYIQYTFVFLCVYYVKSIIYSRLNTISFCLACVYIFYFSFGFDFRSFSILNKTILSWKLQHKRHWEVKKNTVWIFLHRKWNGNISF